MPLVTSSENGTGQTESLRETLGRCGVMDRLTILLGEVEI